MKRGRGGALALLVALAAVAFQQWRVSDPHVRYDRFSLPAFDAYVHVAMAERPSVFTVALSTDPVQRVVHETGSTA